MSRRPFLPLVRHLRASFVRVGVLAAMGDSVISCSLVLDWSDYTGGDPKDGASHVDGGDAGDGAANDDGDLEAGDGAPSSACGPQNCAGCCASGRCAEGLVGDSCGTGGQACDDCVARNLTCSAGACVSPIDSGPACSLIACKTLISCLSSIEIACCKPDGSCGCESIVGATVCM